MICANPKCGKEFDSFRVTHIYCSAKCMKAMWHKRHFIPKGGKPKKVVEKKVVYRICLNPKCAKEFIPARKDKMCCSRRCTYMAQHYKNRDEPPLFLQIRKCAECSAAFTPKAPNSEYCSKKCLHRRWNKITFSPIYPKQCDECSEWFTGRKKGVRYCSSLCNNNAWEKSADPNVLKSYQRKWEGKNKEFIKNKAKKYRDSGRSKELQKIRVERLDDSYIRLRLKTIDRKIVDIPNEVLTPELIELKRTHIKLKRKIYGKQGSLSACAQ